MTLTELGSIGELLGGIAVVISLLYLAVQIRHNSDLARHDAHRALSREIGSILHDIAVEPELYRLWRTMIDEPRKATEEDRERFGMLLYQIFTTFSDSERFGRNDRDLQMRSRRYMDRFLSFESVQSWWSRQGSHYTEPFYSQVEARLRELRAEQARKQ